jgi:hypothetical protein
MRMIIPKRRWISDIVSTDEEPNKRKPTHVAENGSVMYKNPFSASSAVKGLHVKTTKGHVSLSSGEEREERKKLSVTLDCSTGMTHFIDPCGRRIKWAQQYNENMFDSHVRGSYTTYLENAQSTVVEPVVTCGDCSSDSEGNVVSCSSEEAYF